jgi:N-acetylmuramoyl-L-alanine amidase
VLVGILAVLLAFGAGCVGQARDLSGPEPPSRILVPTDPVWPAEGALLQRLAPFTPAGWQRKRVLIDPGHGAPPDNLGNTSVECVREADEMLRISRAIVPLLERTRAFDLRTTRSSRSLVSYPTRIRSSDAWPADALVSLHSDARSGSGWGPDARTGCLRSDEASGFSVLWSDEGSERLVAARRRLARAVAARMIEAGFPAYSGEDYGAYGADPDHPGVFVDRHEPSKRIAMLRRPTSPSIIVETHQALDPAEVARWNEPRTTEAFAWALARGLVDGLLTEGEAGSSSARQSP